MRDAGSLKSCGVEEEPLGVLEVGPSVRSSRRAKVSATRVYFGDLSIRNEWCDDISHNFTNDARSGGSTLPIGPSV